MYKYSKQSLEKLETCDPRIQLISHELIRRFDHSIICGHRKMEEQNKAFNLGFSKLKFPDSTHNVYPSKGWDVVPYPSQFSKKLPFYFMAGQIFAIAFSLKIDIRWGGDFNQDNNFYNDNFIDLAHFEILESKHKFKNIDITK